MVTVKQQKHLSFSFAILLKREVVAPELRHVEIDSSSRERIVRLVKTLS